MLTTGTLVAAAVAVAVGQVALAIPAVLNGLFQMDLGTSASQLTWISDAFLVPVTLLELTFGVLGDLFGRKRLLVGGALILALGELVSVLTPGLGSSTDTRVLVLWVGQALAGIGAAAGPADRQQRLERADAGEDADKPAVASAAEQGGAGGELDDADDDGDPSPGVQARERVLGVGEEMGVALVLASSRLRSLHARRRVSRPVATTKTITRMSAPSAMLRTGSTPCLAVLDVLESGSANTSTRPQVMLVTSAPSR